MQLYDLTVILPTDEAKSKASSEKLEKTIKEASGKVVEKTDWGKKNLSYPINKQTEGIYVLYQLELEEERVGGFNRLLQNDDSVLRHLLVKSAQGNKIAKDEEKVSKKEAKPVAKTEKKAVKSAKKSTKSATGKSKK